MHDDSFCRRMKALQTGSNSLVGNETARTVEWQYQSQTRNWNPMTQESRQINDKK
jgi:hypothetical protein